MTFLIKDINLFVFSAVSSVTILPSFFFFVICPLIIYRKIVISLSKFHPHLAIPLTNDDSITAIDKLYTNKQQSGIVFFLQFENKLNYNLIFERFQTLVNSGKHPKLKYSLTRWLFTFFWKPCPNFTLRDHISKNNESDWKIAQNTLESLATKAMKKGKPLWEVVVFPNFKNSDIGTKSGIALKVHHCLTDGFGILSIIREIVDPSNNLHEEIGTSEKKMVKRLKRSRWQKILYLLELVFITPTETIYSFLKGMQDSQVFSLTDDQKSGELIQYNLGLDMEWIKNISKKLNKTVTNILFAGITSGVRKMLLARGGPSELKNNATIVTVWPKPGHPKVITNHVGQVLIEAPVSVQDQRERLEIITKHFHRLFYSPRALGHLAFASGLGLVQAFINREIRVRHFGTAILSNFAIFGEPYKISGNKAIAAKVFTGCQSRNVSVFITCLSYNGKMMISVSADKNVLKDKAAWEKFVGFLVEEFEALDELIT